MRTTIWMLALLASATHAADIYVDRAGSDANPGSIGSPVQSITRGVALASAGDTVWLRAGTWRESVTVSKSGTAAAPLTIAAYPGETPMVKGSQIVGGWVTSGIPNVWVKTAWTIASQQVFIDSAPLQQIGVPSSFYAGTASPTDPTVMIAPVGAGLADVVAGSFFFDANAQKLYVRLADNGDPNTHLVEASTARRLMMLDGASWVVVRGIAFRHSCTSAFQAGGAAIELGNYCELDRCDIQWCDFAGVAMGYQRSGAQVIGCTISNNGDSGIGASSSYGFTVRGCTITGNNYRGFNTAWHAGGIKCVTKSYGTIENCTINGNKGQGVWFDYCDGGNPSLLRRCLISGNAAASGGGIMVEASKNVTIANNVIADNDRRGVYVAASDDVMVVLNTVTGTRTQNAIDVSGMPRAGKTLTNVTICSNLVSGNACQHDLMMVKENGTDIVGLHCDYNLFYRSTGSVALWWGLDGRGGWAGTTYPTVVAWKAAFAGSTHCLQADPLLVSGQALAANSPAIDAGCDAPGVTDDFGGNPRAGSNDIGALEYGTAPVRTSGSSDSSSSSSSSIPSASGFSGSAGPSSGAGSGSGCGIGSGLAIVGLALAFSLKNVLSWIAPRPKS